ncbi:hypothetical protein UFOVP142_54 [uncultured Caudovirales phage]|uniref:Uncharacterized protein n=1 Tax=uncultured Caudovirales phage TaxID=2100421 RepID=A0A6J7XUI8_9CAUD|nr:hypothetical protein UFOVP142_54 [uncultured Caudovirales phage]
MGDSSKVIPNVVGRIDAIVNEIRFENWPEVERLLREESGRRREQIEQRKRDLKMAQDAYHAVGFFLDDIMTSETARARAVREANK